MIFLESPWPILLIGIAVEAVLAIMLLRSGQGRILWAMIGAGALILGGLGIERLVVTERELVEQTLDTAVSAVRTNNLNALLACISPTAPKTQGDARMVLGLAEFSRAKISEVEITINRLTSPPSAKATFLAAGEARDRRTGDWAGSFARRVTVELRKENGRWMLCDYRDEDFLQR